MLSMLSSAVQLLQINPPSHVVICPFTAMELVTTQCAQLVVWHPWNQEHAIIAHNPLTPGCWGCVKDINNHHDTSGEQWGLAQTLVHVMRKKMWKSIQLEKRAKNWIALRLLTNIGVDKDSFGIEPLGKNGILFPIHILLVACWG